LDEREAMTFDHICEQVRAVVFADLERGLIETEQFEHLLAVVLHQ
jgi:hypothetical protein